jgi:hypothetical protein
MTLTLLNKYNVTIKILKSISFVCMIIRPEAMLFL